MGNLWEYRDLRERLLSRRVHLLVGLKAGAGHPDLDFLLIVHLQFWIEKYLH